MDKLIEIDANLIHKDLCEEGLIGPQMIKVLEMVVEIEESESK